MTAVRCGICESDRRSTVDAFLSAGKPYLWIEREMKRLDAPTKAETVKKHLDRCLGGNRSNTELLDAAASGNTTGISRPDFAAAVQREALKMLAAGQLRIRTADGLSAQALLDRRAEKAADRNLTIEIAMLLSGAKTAPPVEVIEGEWREADDPPGLAPLALVANER